MKVAGITNSNVRQATRKSKASQHAGGFQVPSSSVDEDASPPSDDHPVTPGVIVPALAVLSAQAEEDSHTADEETKQKAVRYGAEVLSALRAAQREIISGSITTETVRRLEDLSQQQHSWDCDPSTRALLRELRLRLTVEKAKIGLHNS